LVLVVAHFGNFLANQSPSVYALAHLLEGDCFLLPNHESGFDQEHI
jgi:hypothetical protein